MVSTAPSTVMASVLFLLLPSLAVAAVPDGSMLNISPECGTGENDTARVTVATDLPFPRVTAKCMNNRTATFFSNDGINFILPVLYTPIPNQCTFLKHDTTSVYSISVFVTWGTGERIQTSEERFYVTCAMDDSGGSSSQFKDIVEALVAPREIQTNLGDNTTSDFTLRMTDILGDDLVSPVDIGKLIKIVATSDGSGGEVGLRAVSCDAVGVETNTKYAILRAGCGDGLIIAKNSGFMTEGRVATSPFFASFRLFNDYNVQLDCNFTLCDTNCDGSSCNTVPSKRSLDDTTNKHRFISLSSKPFLLTHGDKDMAHALNRVSSQDPHETGHIKDSQTIPDHQADRDEEHSVNIGPAQDRNDDRVIGPLMPFPMESLIMLLTLAFILMIVIAFGWTFRQKNKEPFKEPIFTIM